MSNMKRVLVECFILGVVNIDEDDIDMKMISIKQYTMVLL